MSALPHQPHLLTPERTPPDHQTQAAVPHPHGSHPDSPGLTPTLLAAVCKPGTAALCALIYCWFTLLH